MFKFLLNLKWGRQKPPTPPWKQLGFTKIIFNEPKIPFINVHHLWSWLNPLPKMVSYFWRLFWIFAPSHKYLHLGNLNPINILKCPNNLEGIFRLLRIFSNVPLNIFRVFLNGIVFLLFQNTEQKQIKRKTESREETYLAAHLGLTCAGRPTWPVIVVTHLCQ